MARKPTPRQILDALIDLFEPMIRDAFLASTANIVNNIHLTSLIQNISDGDVIAAFRTLQIDELALRPLIVSIESAYEQGGVMTGQTFPKWLNTPGGRVVFRFDTRNSRAEAFLRNRSASLITRLTDEQRLNVRTALERGVRAGRNPRNVALDIVGRVDRRAGQRVGGIIGLSNRQEQWVENTRRDLLNLDKRYFTRKLRDKRFDSVVRRAIADGKPLTNAKVEQLLTRYKDRALKHRADMIARTESIQSLNHAEWEAIRQAVDLGAVNADDVLREWDATGDIRTRFSHMTMDGQRVGIDEWFTSPTGDRLYFPGDTSLGADADETIGCRCRVRTVVDFLNQVRAQ